MDISVAIVEDNNDIRAVLEHIIDTGEGYKLAGSCVNGEEALVNIPLLKPQIVLMDINLGGISGIEVVKILKEEQPDILFMMCTVYEDDDKIFEALNAGANGYVLKKTAPDKLLDSIRELYEGGAPMSSQIARKVVATFQNKTASAVSVDSLDVLSKREKEILESLSKGLLYKEIADLLYISPQTVRKHVYHIYEKLHVGNRIEAVNKFFGR
ncbi:MAG: response regulator transcription factor [Ferruginibacter sp.]